MFQPLDIAIRRWFGDGRAVELALGNREQGIVDQRGFTRAGDAGDAGKQAHWQGQRYILQVVAARAGQLENFFGLAGTRCFGTSILRLPLMNWPVRDSGTAIMASSGPSATTWPP